MPAPVRFAVALASIAIVFVLDRVAGAAIDDGSLFLLLSTAVIATAWLAGTGPALAATVLGAVLGAADAGDVPTDPGAPMHLALFVVEGLLLTAVVSELRSARWVAEREARDASAARREVESVNRMKDEFLGAVSHELRTPLNAILGWVQLLRGGDLDGATARRGLESLERNVKLQAQLTGDLLDVSKALTGQLRLDSRPVALNDAVREAVAAVEPAARARGIALDVSLPDEPLVVLGEAGRLRQMGWQRIANAIKFTPRGGRIEVSTGATRDEAWMTIVDTGSGIDPEFLPRIFDRFTQADGSSTRTAGGLGVGLALVREIAELHGGTIEARNRVEGKGAAFTARFPLQPASLLVRAAGAGPDRRIASGPALTGLRVLVLDQDQDGRELLRAILQQRGATVRTVQTVADALEALEGWSPDVLVSDSASPDHASYALVGRVHTLDADRGGRIPALALTTAARHDERLARMLAGVHSDLPKPIEPSMLASEIARLTGRERRHAVR
jgi:signal transduction histidine kinase/CheY-like chemotaxis protein